MNESKIRTLKRTQRDRQQQKIKQEQDQFQDEKQKLEQKQEQAKTECKRKKYNERATINESKTSTLKCTQRDWQQQKIKQEEDQKDQFQDEKQKLEQEEERAKTECKRKKYHERVTMNQSKTSTLKCAQTDQQQQKIKQEQDQKDQFQGEKQKLEQEQEQAKGEFKRKKYHEREQEQEKREGPQPKNGPSRAAKQGKFQTVVEAVYASESTSHYRNVSTQQGVTMQITETAQHRAYGRATLIRTHCSDPGHEARPTGMENKYQNRATSAGCRNEAPGVKHGSHRGIAHGKMPQIFPPEMQPSLLRALNPPICTLFGLPAPVQNSPTPEAMQQSPIANFLRPSSQETGILMQRAQRPELILGGIGGNIQGLFQQMINESGNKPQQ